MRHFKVLESIPEMRARAVSVGHMEEGWSDEDLFEDQFRNGEFHVERLRLEDVALGAWEEEVADMTLSIVRYMFVSGTASNADFGASRLREFYEAVRQWQLKSLKSTSEILEHFDVMRNGLFSTPDRRGLPWRLEMLKLMSVLEIGIRRRMGISSADVARSYDNAYEKLVLGNVAG